MINLFPVTHLLIIMFVSQTAKRVYFSISRVKNVGGLANNINFDSKIKTILIFFKHLYS